MGRKQKAMEEVYKTQSTSYRGYGWGFDDYVGQTTEKEPATMDNILADIKIWNKAGVSVKEQRLLAQSWYSRGGKMFDKAMEVLSSPLNKALE